MGTLRGDNGGGDRPQEGGGLPDLPPEWGTVIIPDDPGALDDEGTQIRKQFRRAAVRRRWRRRLHLKPEPVRRTTDDAPGLAVPLLIMSIAVIATLVSLFAVAWPGKAPRPITPHAAPTTIAPTVSLARLSLFDANGAALPVKDVSPAVVLLVEGCSCEHLITSTVNAVAAGATPASTSASASPPAKGTTVLVVATRVPTLPGGLNEAVQVKAAADPNNSVRAAVPVLATDRTTAAVLVAPDGTVIRAAKAVTSADDFVNDLAKLH
ncbi:hypothetical protein GCM10010399_39930 [Dactylosporangium fulvum]|uniref:Thioredoxin domain-containing protein n=1 Tax=Dactylosporangium fulvum TaxID=53359 RepID=A0ABY5W1S2_9ACTN|nr:hypothetical protein [Dactylosporangium fulvum]UWP82994.1 hypothetical protein Dfulv_01405 [Dactylosporangium fulvum]